MAGASGGGNDLLEALRELTEAIKDQTEAMRAPINAVGGAGGGGDGGPGGGGGGGGGGGAARGGRGGGPDSISQIAGASGLARLGGVAMGARLLTAGVDAGVTSGAGGGFDLMAGFEGAQSSMAAFIGAIPGLGRATGMAQLTQQQAAATRMLDPYVDLARAGQIDPANLSEADRAGMRQTIDLAFEREGRAIRMQEEIGRAVHGRAVSGSSAPGGGDAGAPDAIADALDSPIMRDMLQGVQEGVRALERLGGGGGAR